MKILTKEEEEAHYNATLSGGIKGGLLGLALKLVQARVYAQGLTLAVLVASAAFEVGDASKGKGRWETVKVLDPNDPEHKHMIEKRIHHEAYQGEDLWRDMVATEERKIAARKKSQESHSNHKKSDDSSDHKKSEDSSSKKSEGSSSSKKSDDSSSSSKPKSTPPPNKNTDDHREKSKPSPTEVETKNRIVRESKSAGKIDYAEAEAIEAKNQARQKQRREDAINTAKSPDDVKVSEHYDKQSSPAN
ncbi:hypothetical protein M7I_6816 [Glarea lozoyensis 74030]|uniref:HIG1 domain-containing protein n=1 Tax=Glarea lozoyensis (strain ATCC 74030 / MF5533) TaxID=1104152 RepID=H0EVL7_GLAL7|nr:hypothetical protein M7I_6816 [Glarea lozoyensis 74030]